MKSRNAKDLKRKTGGKIKPASLDDCKKCECGKIIAWQQFKCLDCFSKIIFGK
jgi:hypothetical protein